MKLHKTKKVCAACHQRKVKCDLYDKDSTVEKCSNCQAFGYDCVVYIRKKRAISKLASNSTIIPTKLPSYVTTSSPEFMDKLSAIQLDPHNYLAIWFEQSANFKGYVGGSHSYPVFAEILDDFYLHRFSGHKLDMTEVDYQIMMVAGCFNLPSQELCWNLITAYFDRIHPIAPFINKTRFMRDYKDLTKAPSILLLQAIMFVGSTVYEQEDWTRAQRKEMRDMSQMFYKRAKVLYDHRGEQYEPIPLLQSLLLLSWNNNGINDKNSLYYTYVSVGTAQAFGLYRDNSNNKKLSSYEKKMYKILWWYIFVRDHSVSVALGRPTAIHIVDCDVTDLTEEDLTDAEIDEPGTTVYPLTQDQLDFFLQMIKLTKVAEIIHKHRVVINSLANQGEPFLHIIKHDDFLLSRWFENLPSNLVFKVHDPSTHNVYSSIITGSYYSFLIVLHKVNMIREARLRNHSDIKGLKKSDFSFSRTRESNSELEDYHPSWGVTFQASFMLYQMFSTGRNRDFIKDKTHYFLMFMYNSAKVMAFHLCNKDTKIAEIADIVVKGTLLMFDEVKENSLAVESFHHVIKRLYENKPFQSILLRDLFQKPQSERVDCELSSMKSLEQNSDVQIANSSYHERSSVKQQQEAADLRKRAVARSFQGAHTEYVNNGLQQPNQQPNQQAPLHHLPLEYHVYPYKNERTRAKNDLELPGKPLDSVKKPADLGFVHTEEYSRPGSTSVSCDELGNFLGNRYDSNVDLEGFRPERLFYNGIYQPPPDSHVSATPHPHHHHQFDPPLIPDVIGNAHRSSIHYLLSTSSKPTDTPAQEQNSSEEAGFPHGLTENGLLHLLTELNNNWEPSFNIPAIGREKEGATNEKPGPAKSDKKPPFVKMEPLRSPRLGSVGSSEMFQGLARTAQPRFYRNGLIEGEGGGQFGGYGSGAAAYAHGHVGEPGVAQEMVHHHPSQPMYRDFPYMNTAQAPVDHGVAAGGSQPVYDVEGNPRTGPGAVTVTEAVGENQGMGGMGMGQGELP